MNKTVDNRIVDLHNIAVSTDDIGVASMARHCIYSELYERRATVGDTMYKILTSNDTCKIEEQMSFEELQHLASERCYDDMWYRLVVAMYYRLMMVYQEYQSIIQVIKVIYNSDMSLEVRWGRLERIEKRIAELRQHIIELEANISLSSDLGFIAELEALPEIKKFAETKSFKDIDFVAIDKKCSK